MTELEDVIFHLFDETASAQSVAFNAVSSAMVDASMLCVQCLLSEGRIMACGVNDSSALAQIFCSKLLNRFEQERPALPAYAIANDSVMTSSIAESSHYNDIYAKQIRALGQVNDILLVITPDGQSAPMIQAIQAAHDRDMPVIALTGRDGGDICRILGNEDIEIRVPVEKITRINEIHYILLNVMCHLIDDQLFGH